jgi:RNA 2',3'-cyclic 3'-phosphodiesterase
MVFHIDGDGPPASGEQQVYLMCKPDAAAMEAMDRLRRTLGMCQRYAAGRFHITLARFGDIRRLPPSVLPLIRRAAASLEAEPFEIALDRVCNNALVGSRMQALHAFRRALVAKLRMVGLEPLAYKFAPHASLSYGQRQPRNVPVPPIVWRAERLLLVNSIHGEGHAVLDSWPLETRQGSLF